MLNSKALVSRDRQQNQQQAFTGQSHTAEASSSTASAASLSPDSEATGRGRDVTATPTRSGNVNDAIGISEHPNSIDASASGSGSFFSDLLADNPIFKGGLGLMVFGGAVAMLRRGTKVAASVAQRRLLISLEIPSKDRAHPWFLHWMAAQAQAQSMRESGLLGKPQKETLLEFLGIRNVSAKHLPISSRRIAKTRRPVFESPPNVHNPLAISSTGSTISPVRILSRDLSVETNYKPHASASTPHAQAAERGTARFSLVPGPGTHWFRYKGVWMRLTRERDGKMVDLSTGAPWETVTLTTLFAYADLFPQLLEEARQLALASTEGKTVIYTSWGAEWRPFGQPRRTRELGSVVLGKGKKEMIVEDVKRFLERDNWYAERGIPYRRGYLLHGPPGSGKSSFITALAGHLDFNICLLNLSERGLTDDKLNHLLSNAPERSILLLEDVDAAFLGRQKTAEDGYQASVTFSGLLNALDGVASGESRIIFMTTNHIERLDPALIRPGRVDVISELGDAETEQIKDLMIRFYRTTLREQKIREADIPVPPDDTGTKHSIMGTSSAIFPEDASPTQERSSSVPGLAEAIGAADSEIEHLATEFSRIVGEEAVVRRAALGLDASGRVPLAPVSSKEQSNVAPAAEEIFKLPSRKATRSIHALPAASGGVSMAELQGLFIRFPDHPHAAVRAFLAENKFGHQKEHL